MPTLSLRRLTLLAVLILPLLARPAFALSANRIGTVDSSVTATVAGTAHPMALPQFDQGAVANDMPLNGLMLNFQRSAAQQAALETLIQAQNEPGSAYFHQWLTPEAFAAQFGMSAQDIAKTTAWLQSQGFSIVKVVDSGNAIIFSGTAGQVRSAFGTEIHHYAVNGVSHFANSSAITLPAALAGVVTGVTGLDDFKPQSRAVRTPLAATAPSTQGPTALFTSGISGSHFLTPGDLSTIYDVTPLASSAYTGAGVTIGIAGETDVVLSDITAFRAAAGLTVNNPTILLIPGSGDPGISYTDLGEADLDMEWSGGMAPGANVVFLNSTDAFQSLLYGIQNRVTVNSASVLIPILSISYGLCEAGAQTLVSPTSLANMESAFQQAATQGQTVISAAGDNGAADCDSGDISQDGLAVDYPASSAYVTGIGGTEFNEGSGTGATTYWNGNVSGNSSTDIVASAKSYIPEMAWNDTPTALLAASYGELFGGGGGKSILFTKPTWQTGVTGIPADGQRDVPDISLNASPVHDGYLVCTQVILVSTNQYAGSCGNGFRTADGSAADTNQLTVYGGTSLGAPSFAGMLALIEQKVGSQQGLINPVLYGIASNATTYASAFHDITVGNNQMPCSSGNGCINGVVGYAAGTGYDQATGLGSIDANNLATAFASYLSVHPGKVGTTVSLTYTPPTLVIGQAVTFTATVAKTGSNVGTPTGSVTFSIDGIAGSAVNLVAGVATTTYSFASGGTHTVVASYSGDTTDYASLSPTLTLTNFSNAAGSAATTTVLSSSGSTASLYSQSSPSYTATVTSTTAGTIGGTTVTFTVGTGSAAVSTKVSSSSCSTLQCTFILPAGNVLAATGYSAGTTTVSAHYDGNTGYQQSQSNSLSITVLNTVFTITTPSSVSVSSGALASATTAKIVVTSSGGFNDSVNLTLSSLNYPGCAELAPDPVTPTANGTATSVLTIGNCTNASVMPYEIQPRSGVVSAGLGAGSTKLAREAGILLALLACIACMVGRKRGMPRLAAVLMITLLGGLLMGTTGCGGGTSGSIQASLPTGTYQVTVTGTDATNPLEPQVSVTFTVVVH